MVIVTHVVLCSKTCTLRMVYKARVRSTGNTNEDTCYNDNDKFTSTTNAKSCFCQTDCTTVRHINTVQCLSKIYGKVIVTSVLLNP